MLKAHPGKADRLRNPGALRAAALLFVVFFSSSRNRPRRADGALPGGGLESGLFDQYDTDGYSLAVSRLPRSLWSFGFGYRRAFESRAPYRPELGGLALPPARDRDLYTRRLVRGSRTQVRSGPAPSSRHGEGPPYDPDRLSNQDPRACICLPSTTAWVSGALRDLLRRAGIPARTVQGILRSEPERTG